MRHFGLVVVLLLVGAISLSADEPSLLGYSKQSATAERELENKFRAVPSSSNIREYMQRLSAHPHNIGTAHDKENAEWILSKFKEWGLDAHIETFDVLYPTPRQRLVELTEPTKFTAKLQEPALPQDPTSNQQAEQLPTYNIYTIDGDVTAPLVYVNYGIPEDYERMERMGVSVKGAIVIARYGRSWRGIKPKVAAEHGAVGCLIYSDPRDDGYFQGEVFPNGPYRNSNGVQRGSVMDMVTYPGDPLTPGVGATADAKRLDLAEVKVFTRIPTLPLSYGDAEPLLKAITGPVAPENWRGALPFTYHVGPGAAKVHLVVKSNWDRKPLYNVIARIPGSESPDEWVVRGNHHDAWVNGAQDPISGTSPLMEEARAFGELMKTGWHPKRTIILAAWDGEEAGLLGSTEWGEAHADELGQKAVAYINSDSNSRGYLEMGGSHSLESFINEVAKDVTDPEKKISVWARDKAQTVKEAKSAEDRQEVRNRRDLHMDALGSGSDYTVFMDHLGIASLSLGYGGEGDGGIYHSIYDDFYWYTHFDDTDLSYGKALAQTAGTATMRLADADVLPLEFNAVADTISRYVREVEKLAGDTRDRIAEQNRQLDDGVYSATTDPKEKFVPPTRETIPPHLNFAPLHNGLDRLKDSAERYRKAYESSSSAGIDPEVAKSLNARLLKTERALMLPEGLPNRPWFKHQIYAPGFYTGYGVKTLPAVREAIEQKQWQEADAAIARVGKVLENEAAAISAAADELQRVAR